MILQYINALNKLKVFLKIEFAEEDEDNYIIKIFKSDASSSLITKKEFLAAASAVRYLYESGSGAMDKRPIPYFFLYLNKFKELLPLERLFLAHCCKKFNFYGTGHSLYFTKEKSPKTDVNEIKKMLEEGKELTSSFTSNKISSFIPPSYETRAELDELVQKFITYKKNGF